MRHDRFPGVRPPMGHGVPRRSLWYAVAGAILSLGAPVGLLLLREVIAPQPLSEELISERIVYLYVLIATAIALALFGFIIGRQTDRLAALSQTDALTGLANRRALSSLLEKEIRRSARYGMPASLLLIDVDGLKQVNDNQGHSAGDRVLRSVADAITEALRGTDVGARWGGDEFAIVAPNTTAEAALRSAERLVGRVAEAGGHDPWRSTTVSVGIATFDPAYTIDCDLERLLRAADDALYRAKASGRNQVQAA
jgi:diguanylate cyclase (GGDEF)-like protein